MIKRPRLAGAPGQGASRAVTVGVVALLVLLAAGSTLGPTAALLSCVLAAGVCALALLGPTRLGIVFLGGAFLTAPMYRGIGSIGPITPTDGLMFLGLLLLVPLVLEHSIELPVMLVVPAFVLMVLGLVASAVSNAAPVASIIYVIQWLVVFAVLPAFIALLRPSRRFVDGLLWCYIAGQMASLLKALAGHAASNGRYQGFAGHPNDFGLAGAAAVVAVICLLPHYKETRVRVLLLGLGALSMYSIVISGSRGSTLAIAVVIALIPVVERSSVWGVALTLVGACGVAMLPYVIQLGGAGGSLHRLTGDATAKASDSERSAALAEGWHRFLGSPFLGSGLDPLVGEYHNLFLEAAIAVGVVGLLAFLVLCFLFIRPSFSLHPMRRLSYMAWLFLVSGITFPGLVDRTILVPMALGILATVPPHASEIEDAAPSRPLAEAR